MAFRRASACVREVNGKLISRVSFNNLCRLIFKMYLSQAFSFLPSEKRLQRRDIRILKVFHCFTFHLRRIPFVICDVSETLT